MCTSKILLLARQSPLHRNGLNEVITPAHMCKRETQCELTCITVGNDWLSSSTLKWINVRLNVLLTLF